MAAAPSSILLVDDDESLLELCDLALRDEGYEIVLAPTGDAALELLAKRAFDLVVTDLSMPGKTDGHGVVLAVKTRYPSTEVIVMTGVPTLRTAIDTLKDGAYDYITKPLHLEGMKATLRRCLDHRRLRHDLDNEQEMRRELESTYRELQKVEELKAGFLSRISHEIRTPLHQLGLALKSAEEAAAGTAGPEAERLRSCIDLSKRGAARLDRTLAELLAFVDLQQGMTLAAHEPVDLAALCRDAADHLRPVWEPLRLEVRVDFPPGTGTVEGDPAMLRTAFMHLLHNAMVFNREGGRVDVLARAHPGALEVTVRDTGEGIPESEFKHLFDSFYQIANYLTRKVQGLGLGLAITRRIIEAHGGEIGVSSEAGKGTSFRVLLPLPGAAAPPAGSP